MMNSLRLLIVDDEPLIRAGIRADLSGVESIRVAGECGTVAEAIATIRSDQFDLVLLDVQMPDGTGFDVIREVGPQRMPTVVFVTAYETYALRAFEVNAVDYLLKPFNDVRLRESIDRVRARLSRTAPPTRMAQLIEAHSQLLTTLDKQAEEVRRAHTEMASAREVQEELFPRGTSRVPGIEYAGRCAPARNLSGDYYDFLPFGEGCMGIILADVSGKGAPAALLMANLQGSFRTLAGAGWREPVELLQSINQLLYESTSAETFATLFFGYYDCATHQLRYVNCGHPAPYLLRAGGEKADRLQPTSTVLGAFPRWRSDECWVELAPGDTLLAYTDGLTEARSADGTEFGDSRLYDALASARSDTPDAILEKVIGTVQGFSSGIQEDDITALVLQRAPHSSAFGDRTSTYGNRIA